MKVLNLKLIAIVIMGAVILSGCGIKKMVKKYPEVKYQIEPEVLETHGGKINVKVTGKVPEKYFAKKAMVEFKPVLTYANGTTTLKTVYLKGEKAKGEGQIISKRNGGNFEFTDVIAYKQPDMNVSELKVTPTVYPYKKPQKSKVMDETKLADGVIYTSERVGKDEIVRYMDDHGYKKEEFVTKSANLYFAYNKSNLDMNLGLNKDLAKKQKIDSLLAFIKLNWKIKSFEVNAWASPEGELSLNEKLSNERAKTGDVYISKFINDFIKKKEVKFSSLKEIPYVVNAKGEDFQGFMKSLNASNIPDKNAIKNVIESQATKTEREQQIRNMTVIYEEIEAILSDLRRAEFSVTCFLPKRTDANIAELSTSYPDSLKLEELLYAATLTNDLNTKLKIYESTTKIYPSNWKAYCNAGAVYLELAKAEEAKNFLNQANSLQPNNGMVLNNLGILNSWNKDFAGAKEYYENAKSKGVNTDYNMGILAIRDGDYASTTRLFGNTTCTYNVALNKVLNKDYQGATNDLDCLKEKNAQAYYLMAVIGARTNNSNMLYTNLKKAIAEEPAYKSQAKEDREFIKFFGNTEFQSAVQ